MDEWRNKYLIARQLELNDDPDPDTPLNFLQDAITALKELFPPDGGTATATVPRSRPEAVASSIAIMIYTQENPDELLSYFQRLLFDAAITSPLDPGDLAKVIRSFVLELHPPLDERFQRDLGEDIEERLNGPESPSTEKDTTQCIQAWLSLNTFAAHLAQTQAAPLEGYALLTLNRAAGCATVEELDCHVPAAGAWMCVLGKNVYDWSVSGQDAGEQSSHRSTWGRWKQMFENYGGMCLRPEIRMVAEKAWQCMDGLDAGK